MRPSSDIPAHHRLLATRRQKPLWIGGASGWAALVVLEPIYALQQEAGSQLSSRLCNGRSQNTKIQGRPTKLGPSPSSEASEWGLGSESSLRRDNGRDTGRVGNQGHTGAGDTVELAVMIATALRASIGGGTSAASQTPSASPGEGIDYSINTFMAALSGERGFTCSTLQDIRERFESEDFVSCRDLLTTVDELVAIGLKRGQASAVMSVLCGPRYRLPRAR
jgi:hypothetical protein